MVVFRYVLFNSTRYLLKHFSKQAYFLNRFIFKPLSTGENCRYIFKAVITSQHIREYDLDNILFIYSVHYENMPILIY